MSLVPFAHTAGPRDARIVIVGESWGEQEERLQLPFVGASGQELTRMLREAEIDRYSCLLTNVFPLRPPENNIEALCGKKAEVGADYKLPPIRQGKYIRPEYLPHLERLAEEIRTCAPNLVIAFGNIAMWALLRATGIGALRGAVAESRLIPGVKVLPTYHPAAVLRNWAWRVIVVADLQKAKRESAQAAILRPEREILISPTLDEISSWLTRPAVLYACDIETFQGQIEMIGLARSPREALVVPFVNKNAKLHEELNYWPDVESEAEARRLVNMALAGAVPKLFQNGLYDVQYLWREGFTLRNVREDTMLLHHSMFPEMQKGLGFMGSIYTEESSWKHLRKQDDTKRDA